MELTCNRPGKFDDERGVVLDTGGDNNSLPARPSVRRERMIASREGAEFTIGRPWQSKGREFIRD
jgi:hypothetical protein